jgi:RNA polymerase sigma factor (sigma-70 family)
MDSDVDLLRRFSATGDEEAFRGLVQRHAPMVQGVALRKTGDPGLADEVTQSVFAVLARRSKSIRHDNLGGWLHNAAFFEAQRALDKAARYQQTLKSYAHHMKTTGSDDDGELWHEVRPHLDEALSLIDAQARDLLVRHYFQDCSIREIAIAIGKSEAASRKRIQRSMVQLRKLLRRRGITASVPALGAVLTGQNLCAPAAPAAALAASVITAAPSLQLSVLFAHSLHTMNIAATAKTVAVVLLLSAIPVTLLWQRNTELEKQLSDMRATARTASINSVSKPPFSREDSVLSKSQTASATKEANSEKPTAFNPTAANPIAPGFMALLAKMTITDGGMKKFAEEEGKKRASRDFLRLSVSIPDLTEKQKALLKDSLEKHHAANAQQITKASDDPLFKKMVSDPQTLTQQERIGWRSSSR